MKHQRGFTLPQLICLIIVLAGAVGWVWNIVKLVDLDWFTFTFWHLARGAGIVFPPLGAVLGYL